MSNELAVWTPPGPPTPAEWDSMRNAAIMLAKSDLIPKHFQGKPENVLVAVLTGRGIGIDWMLAVQKGYVIDGKFGLEAEVMADVVRRNVPGFDFEVLELSDEKCILKGGVAGRVVHTVEFTYAQAKLAGYTEGKYGEKDNWKPGRRADSLYAKALRRLIKRTGGYYAVSMAAVRDDDESDDLETPPAPKREPSRAAVVEESQAAPDPVKPAGPVEVAHPGEDWQYRLLCAFAQATRLHSDQYAERLADPPSKQPGRTRWAKANGADLMRTVNAYYAECGMDPIKSWAMFPPLDAQNVAVWLEERNAKGAGNAGQDAPVAQEAPPAPPKEEPGDVPADLSREPGAGIESGEQAAFGFDAAPPPPEAPPNAEPTVADITETLSNGPLDDLLRALDDLKFRSKGERRYYEIDSKTGEPFLRDGEFLTDLGYVRDMNGNKAPVSQWLKTLWAKDADRVMLARRVAEDLCEKEMR